MAWWVWVLLAAFMIVVLAVGGIYVFRRAVAALRIVSGVGAKVSDRLERMGEREDGSDSTASPSFVHPLRQTAERYSDAHAAVIERRRAARMRHAQAWRRWRGAL